MSEISQIWKSSVLLEKFRKFHRKNEKFKYSSTSHLLAVPQTHTKIVHKAIKNNQFLSQFHPSTTPFPHRPHVTNEWTLCTISKRNAEIWSNQSPAAAATASNPSLRTLSGRQLMTFQVGKERSLDERENRFASNVSVMRYFMLYVCLCVCCANKRKKIGF